MTADQRGWHRHRSVMLMISGALALAILGILLGRGALIALGTPLFLSGLWSLNERPVGTGSISTAPALSTGSQRTLVMQADLNTNALPEVTAVRMRISFPGAPVRDILFSTLSPHPLEFTVESVRTGARELFTLNLVSITASLGWFGPEIEVPANQILVLPRVDPLPVLPSSATVRGLTGPRPSRRRGEGFEFRDVALMTPGSRARQIDWRVTARLSPELEQLYVRRNYAQAESTTMILVDSRDDVGTEIASWGSAHQVRPDQMTSLDIARTAAASLAKAALDSGDRVGVEDLGRPRSPVLPGTGMRHFDRIAHSLALAKPLGAPRVRTRAPFVPSGALVYVLSTFLDETAFVTVASLVRLGHTVIAVDTLPQTNTWSLVERQLMAWRLVNLDRDAQIALTRNLGVTVIRWSGPTRDYDLSVATKTMSSRGHQGPQRGSR